MPSCRLMSFFLIAAIVSWSLVADSTTPAPSATTDSYRDVPTNYGGGIGRDGKPLEPYWRPEFHPVNNIQIGGCCRATPNNAATDDLMLNLTRTILDILQKQERRSVPSPTYDVGRPRDCSEIQANGMNTSGVYPIYPDGDGDPFFVYCDMETDGGGWTVFQRRQDGSVDFFLYWSDYKYGFGSVSAEHWLGNDKIHGLTTQKTYELRVDLEDFDGQTRYATYSEIRVADEAANYTLTLGDYSGNAGDSLTFQADHPFSTRDRDNDRSPHDWENCAERYRSGWWYSACHYSNLNGLYLNGAMSAAQNAKGIVWLHWLGHRYSLKKTEMKMRPVPA